MKTLAKSALALLLVASMASCMSSGAPNDTVTEAFKHKFGEVKSVKWTHNEDFSYAHFEQNHQQVVAVFGNDGQYMATEPAKPIQ